MMGAMFLLPQVSWAAADIDQAKDPYGVGATAGQAGLKATVVGESDVASAIGGLVASALAFVGVIFFILVLYAGFTWMLARGDSGKIDKAKTVLEDAVIGMLLVSAAYAIANFMFGTVVGGGKCAAVGGVCTTGPSCTESGGFANQTAELCPGSPTAGSAGIIICCVATPPVVKSPTP